MSTYHVAARTEFSCAAAIDDWKDEINLKKHKGEAWKKKKRLIHLTIQADVWTYNLYSKRAQNIIDYGDAYIHTYLVITTLQSFMIMPNLAQLGMLYALIG